MTDIFVFGSNLAGKHGAGSALAAMRYYGAKYGIGVGFLGDSYAIPTKDCNFNVLELYQIEIYVQQFLEFAAIHPEMTFKIVAIGCGLAGFKPEQIAPMFEGCTNNCILPPEFLEVLNR